MLEALQGRLRKWLSCGCRQQLLPFGRRPARCIGRGPAHDVRLNHEVVWTTNHHKMFGIVTADEDDASFAVDREGFYYCYPRWCVAIAQPFEHGRSPHSECRSEKQYGDVRQTCRSRQLRKLPAVPAVVMSTVPAVMSSGVVIITARPRAGARIACGFLLRILLGAGLVFAIALRRGVLFVSLFRRARRRRNRLRRNLGPRTRIGAGTRPRKIIGAASRRDQTFTTAQDFRRDRV